MKQSSSTLKKMTLELGGNGAFIVFDDADLERATDGECATAAEHVRLTFVALVANKFRAAGQVCMCANRVMVHSSLVDEFAALMKTKIEQLKFGHGLDKGQFTLLP